MRRTDEELRRAFDATQSLNGRLRRVYDLGRANERAALAGELPSDDDLFDTFIVVPEFVDGLRAVATLAAAHASARTEAEIVRLRETLDLAVKYAREDKMTTPGSTRLDRLLERHALGSAEKESKT